MKKNKAGRYCHLVSLNESQEKKLSIVRKQKKYSLVKMLMATVEALEEPLDYGGPVVVEEE